jgi:hypothetical protein
MCTVQLFGEEDEEVKYVSRVKKIYNKKMITHKAPKDELLCLSGRHVCHREVFMCSL